MEKNMACDTLQKLLNKIPILNDVGQKYAQQNRKKYQRYSNTMEV